MAYIPQQIPEDQKNIFASTSPTTPNPQSSGSVGAVPAGGAAPGVATPTQFGSSASRLTDYLKANQQQVQDFGNKVASDLTNQYNQTLGSINQGVNQFGQQVGQGYTPPDQNRLSEAATNPTEFVKNPQNVQDFQSWYNSSYTGPQNFEGSSIYSNLNNQVNKAVENADLTKTLSGLGTYLGTNGRGVNSTGGINTLDAALLARNPQSREAIQSAASPYKTLNDYLSQQTSQSDADIAKAKETANTNRTSIQNQFTGEGGLVPTLTNTLNQQLSTARGGYDQQYNQALNAFRNGTLTPEQAKFLGFNPNDISDKALMGQGKTADILRQDYGLSIPLQNYFTTPPADVVYSNLNSAATPEQAAYEAALQQLTGMDAGINENLPLGYQNQISISRPELGQLSQQLIGLDQNTLLGYPAALGLSPGYSFQDAVTQLQNYPERLQMLLDNADKATPDKSQVLRNALKRMGYTIPGTPPPPVDTGGGTVGIF